MSKTCWNIGNSPSDEIDLNNAKICPECNDFNDLTIFNQLLNCGSYGCIYGLDPNNNELSNKWINKYGSDIVMKVQGFNIEDVKREYEIGKIAGDLGLGGKYYELITCDINNIYYGNNNVYEIETTGSAIIMEKFEMTVFDYINSFSIEEKSNIVDLLKNRAQSKLDKLHDIGLVHGDVQISNMMIKGDDIYLIDFGISDLRSNIESQAEWKRLVDNDNETLVYEMDIIKE